MVELVYCSHHVYNNLPILHRLYVNSLLWRIFFIFFPFYIPLHSKLVLITPCRIERTQDSNNSFLNNLVP